MGEQPDERGVFSAQAEVFLPCGTFHRRKKGFLRVNRGVSTLQQIALLLRRHSLLKHRYSLNKEDVYFS